MSASETSPLGLNVVNGQMHDDIELLQLNSDGQIDIVVGAAVVTALVVRIGVVTAGVVGCPVVGIPEVGAEVGGAVVGGPTVDIVVMVGLDLKMGSESGIHPSGDGYCCSSCDSGSVFGPQLSFLATSEEMECPTIS